MVSQAVNFTGYRGLKRRTLLICTCRCMQNGEEAQRNHETYAVRETSDEGLALETSACNFFKFTWYNLFLFVRCSYCLCTCRPLQITAIMRIASCAWKPRWSRILDLL